MGVLADIVPSMAPAQHLWRIGLEEAKGRTADFLVARVVSNGLAALMQAIVDQDHPKLIAVPADRPYIVLDEKEFAAPRSGKSFEPLVLNVGTIGVTPYSFTLSIPAKPELQRLLRAFGVWPRNEYHVTIAYANQRIEEGYVKHLLERLRKTRMPIQINAEVDAVLHLRRTPKHRVPFEYDLVREWLAKEQIAPGYSSPISGSMRSRSA